MTRDKDVLLLSGGVDSTALAALVRPAVAVYVDYGQRPAAAERQAARAVSGELDLELIELELDLTGLGAGLLLDERPSLNAPSPEWWPYRNQHLATAAASVALRRGLGRVVLASVAGDGDRHADGTAEFYNALDKLLRLQEGGVGVAAPALAQTTEQLLARSGLAEDVIGWTVSCHRSNLPCGDCPGCWKRTRVLRAVGMLQ